MFYFQKLERGKVSGMLELIKCQLLLWNQLLWSPLQCFLSPLEQNQLLYQHLGLLPKKLNNSIISCILYNFSYIFFLFVKKATFRKVNCIKFLPFSGVHINNFMYNMKLKLLLDWINPSLHPHPHPYLVLYIRN